MPTTPHVRSFEPADLEALYDICVRTADAGGDARGQYSSDRLMGDLFAAPYATLEPEHAHVLDDGTGTAVGYVVGTADTPAFVARYRSEWIPASGLPLPAEPPQSQEDVMLGLHHRPERMLVPEVAAYPAHLHIDLLPEWQGRGFGRALMAALLDGLRGAGVGSVHLGMLSTNTAARAFYDRLGFHVVADIDPVTYLGRSTDPL